MTSRNGGKLPTQLYLVLRLRRLEILALRESNLSQRQQAFALGIGQTTYRRLCALLDDLPAEYWRAADRGDWRQIEEVLFSKLAGDYTLLPSYQRVIAMIEGTDATSSPKPKARAPAKSAPLKKPSFRRFLRRLCAWLLRDR